MSQRKRVKPIKFSFNERKAVQAAGRLVANAGGEINYLALMKLLYLIDREALIRFGKPITGDNVVAMKHGPVLSRIYDLVAHKKRELPTSEWHQFIPRTSGYVCTVKFAGVPNLLVFSQAELGLIDEIFATHQGKSEWELAELTCAFPEWRIPKNAPTPIPLADILRAAKVPKGEIEAIAHEAAADLYMEEALASAKRPSVRGKPETREPANA